LIHQPSRFLLLLHSIENKKKLFIVKPFSYHRVHGEEIRKIEKWENSKMVTKNFKLNTNV